MYSSTHGKETRYPLYRRLTALTFIHTVLNENRNNFVFIYRLMCFIFSTLNRCILEFLFKKFCFGL